MALLLMLFIAPAPAGDADHRSARSSGGGVDIEIVFENADPQDAPDPGTLVFGIFMDTHSGDLTETDFPGRITVTSDGRTADPSGLVWSWASPSTHHPSAGLTVANRDLGGERLVTESSRTLSITISDLRGTDHRFDWDLSRPYLAVVTNEGDGTLSIVDLDSGQVVETIAVGDKAGHGLAVSPDGRRLFAGDLETGILYTIDTMSLEFERQLDIGAGIHGIDISPDGRYLFISPIEEDAGNLVVVEVETNRIVKRFDDAFPGRSDHVAFDRDSRFAVSTLMIRDLVQIIDVTSLEVLAAVEVGNGPNESRISPDGRYAYIANWESDDVTVLDLHDYSIPTTIPAGRGTHAVAVTADGSEIWTANRRSNDVTIIETASWQLQDTIASGEYANHIKFTPDGRYALVTNARGNELAVIERVSREVVARIPVGMTPHEIAFIPDRRNGAP